MRTFPVFPLLGLLLGGCLGGGPGAPVDLDHELAAAQLPTGYEYACPLGGPHVRRGALCLQPIDSPTESLQEPYLVVDPKRPNVLAMGVDVGNVAGAPDPGRTGVDLVRMELFVSEDAGAHWRRVRLPALPDPATTAPVEVGMAIDPALAFDEQGTLHVTGMFRQGGTSWRIFYISTPDLGASWNPPVVLAKDPGNDRSWIAAGANGTVYVTWGNPGRASEVAWSRDGGRSWQTAAVPGSPACEEIGPPVARGPEAWFPCTAFADAGDVAAVRVLRFHPGDASFTPVFDLAGVHGEWPILVVLQDGSLVLVAESSTQVWATRSPNGGRTWTEPVDLRIRTGLDDAWRALEYQWVAADPWGGLHVLLKGGTVCLDESPGLIDCRDAEVVHLALDPEGFRPVGEARLTPDSPTEAPRVPPPLAPEFGAEYDALAFGPEAGYALWTRDAGLDATRLLPRWGPAEPDGSRAETGSA